jgi:hypothetical protein
MQHDPHSTNLTEKASTYKVNMENNISFHIMNSPSLFESNYIILQHYLNRPQYRLAKY